MWDHDRRANMVDTTLVLSVAVLGVATFLFFGSLFYWYLSKSWLDDVKDRYETARQKAEAKRARRESQKKPTAASQWAEELKRKSIMRPKKKGKESDEAQAE